MARVYWSQVRPTRRHHPPAIRPPPPLLTRRRSQWPGRRRASARARAGVRGPSPVARLPPSRPIRLSSRSSLLAASSSWSSLFARARAQATRPRRSSRRRCPCTTLARCTPRASTPPAASATRHVRGLPSQNTLARRTLPRTLPCGPSRVRDALRCTLAGSLTDPSRRTLDRRPPRASDAGGQGYGGGGVAMGASAGFLGGMMMGEIHITCVCSLW